jgi:hypothetical protein
MKWIPITISVLIAANICLAQTPTKDSAPSKKATLSGPAADLYQKAKSGKHFADAAKLNPDILPTSDGQSFLVVWKAVPKPKRWIVSLHGSNGFGTADLAIWHPHLKDRDVGIVCLQWWLGSGDKISSYYTPEQIHREIDIALQQLGVETGTVMLHGFSRGSANSYAVMALDAGQGRKFFTLAVASSGGVGLNYPPTRAILEDKYGKEPLKDTRWITVAGAHDPQPERDGIPGMRQAAAWLKKQGAIILDSIEDPDQGHGALMLNAKNAKRVLDLFLKDPVKLDPKQKPNPTVEPVGAISQKP